MDLDTYALSYEAANAETRSNVTSSSDAKGKSRAIDPDTSAAASDSSNPNPTLASDVQQLTTSLGSWWSGFSKQSAETFAQAQTKFQEASKNVNEQGGIVEYAKREAKRIEKELDEKRREAKERVQKQQEQQQEEDKARRAKEDQEAVQKRAEQPDQSADTGKTRSSIDVGPEPGQEIFDADHESTPAASTQSTSAASNASTTATSLFDRLQSLSSDPKVASLQRDVTARIHSLNLFGPSAGAGTGSATTDPSAREASTSGDTIPTIFSDLSKSLAKLSSPETKELAKKYMKASEDVMSKVGEEWRDFVGDLVRVVPPEDQDQHEGDGKSATAQDEKQRPEEGSTSQASLDKAAGPQTTTPESSSKSAVSDADAARPAQQTTSKVPTTATPTPPSAAPTPDMGPETTSKPPHGADDAGDSDSDWE